VISFLLVYNTNISDFFLLLIVYNQKGKYRAIEVIFVNNAAVQTKGLFLIDFSDFRHFSNLKRFELSNKIYVVF
jgi:hypothetical protein